MIVLIRHGQAETAFDHRSDADRALTDLGVRQIQSTVVWLQALGLKSPRVLSSPYKRAQQSARILTGDYDLNAKVTPVTPIEDAETALQPSYGQHPLVVFMHQPLIGALVNRWTGQPVLVDTGSAFVMTGDLLAPNWLTLTQQYAP